MHFFYLDESGCSGADLVSEQEPVFVLGGISVKDQGWVKTTQEFQQIIESYFHPNPVPDDFELHAFELLSPNGEGPFLGHNRNLRNKLAFDVLDLVIARSHRVHLVAIDKAEFGESSQGTTHQVIDPKIPFLFGFDYLTTVINRHVKSKLGHTSRGMIILDEKEQFDPDIRKLTRYRRFEIAKSRRLKWLVEFSYPIDSKKHPLVQMSDLVVFTTRKFFELDRGYRPAWPIEAKQFYTACFERIYDRKIAKSVVSQQGTHAASINELAKQSVLKPSTGWKSKY